MIVGTEHTYYTLVASLPALAPPFVDERPPLSRFALERRLGMLSAEDRAELDALEDIVFFDRLSWSLPNEEVIARFEAGLARVERPALREVARWRLSLRTVIAVLRKRQAGLPFDPAREGVGPLTSLMVANWSRPDLGLGAVFPWVARLAELLQRERTKDVERFIFRTVWEELSLRGFRHTFDFEAVAFYVLKWDLVYRATHEDEGLATVRFRELLDSSGASPDLSAWAEG